MNARMALASMVLLLLAACSQPPTPIPEFVTDEEYAVYRDLLIVNKEMWSIPEGTETVVLFDHTFVRHDADTVRAILNGKAGVSEELVANYLQANSRSYPLEVSFELGKPVLLASQEAIKNLVRGLEYAEQCYAAVRAIYPPPEYGGWFYVSRVGFDRRMKTALLYIEKSLCGGAGNFLVLENASGVWKIKDWAIGLQSDPLRLDSPAEVSDEEYAVYDALLTASKEFSLGSGYQYITVYDQTGLSERLTQEAQDLVPSLRQEMPGVTEELVTNLIAVNTEPYHLAPRLVFEVPVVPVSWGEYEALSAELEEQECLAAARERFPQPEFQGWFRLSRVGFNQSIDQALVYIEAHLCGGAGFFVLLEKQGNAWGMTAYTPFPANMPLTASPLPTALQPSPTVTSAATDAPESPVATAQATSVPVPLALLPPPVTPLTQALAGPITAANAASVAEIARWGGGAVGNVAYSPDGQQVALFTLLGVEVRDVETLAEQPFQGAEPGWSLAAFSADWQTFAWLSGNQIRLRRVSDGAVLRTLDGQADANEEKVAFSPDGSLLASLSFASGEEVYIGSVELWRLSDGALLKTWDAEGSDLAWSPDGKLLATWFAMSGVSVWSVPDGVLVHLVEGGALNADFSPDGQTLAVATFGPAVQLWRVSDWAQLWQIEAEPRCVCFSPDGTLLALAPVDGAAQLVRASDGQAVRTVGYGLADSAAPISFSPDGRVVALGSSVDVQFWRAADGTLLQVLEGHSGGIASTAVYTDGRTLAFLSRTASPQDVALHVWALSSGSVVPVPGTGDALSFALSPDGEMAALGTWQFAVRLVQVPTGQEIRTLSGFDAQVQSVVFSPTGDQVAASSMEEVRLWRVADGTQLQQWPVPGGGWMVSATFSPDGSLLAAQAALPSGTIWVWHVDSGQVVLTLEGDEYGYADYLAFLPDGTALAVERPGELELWSLAQGRLLRTLPVAADVGPFAFSPDGALLALGAGDRVELRRVSDGELLATLVAHLGWVGSVAFSPDGQFLVTGAEDGTVRLWGVPAEGG